ncbi:MAG TPA: GHMP kinase [Anaerolineae bacterium]|nr:GHMP kinase [Anaerolineae bacterium]
MALIAQAPVRISFGGGGTDLAAYYRRYGGIVISTAINRYVYTIVSDGVFDSQQIISADYHTFYRRPLSENLIWDGDLALPKTVLGYFGIKTGLDIFLASEVPPGTGLGSSGSVAVSMAAALSAWLDRPVSKGEIAEIACHIEIDRMGMPVGKQDQYAAAFGGLNVFTFTESGVEVEPIHLDPDTLTRLQRSIVLFYTGQARDSANILKHQRNASEEDRPEVIQRLHAIKALALEIRDALTAGDIAAFGQLLHQSWLNKRALVANISNSNIDEWYEVARRAGAIGGKITGAGGGGFLMLICPPEAQPAVTEALGARGLRRMDFAFDFHGARVVSTEMASVLTR